MSFETSLIETLLKEYRDGALTLEEAKRQFKEVMEGRTSEKSLAGNHGYANLGFAKLDTDREHRSGFPEVIFCSGKPDDYLVSIYRKMVDLNGSAFGTRASQRQADLVMAAVPEATYDSVSRILKVEKASVKASPSAPGGRIAVCTGGTADIPVAEEAAQTAEYFGATVDRFYDVGVSGLHRLLDSMADIRKADCVIAVAGMEGALPTVIGGMVRNPVIAVPTSVGYGANFQGLSSLLTMINSCANGVAVVNIDNGYGAGYMATQIGRLAAGGRKDTFTGESEGDCRG